ncbi:hypothetical protein SPI_02720 [Niveomyces insectorum RCEF 264]|uniref:DUF1446 domain containing protein n=1 Tax=Niveomyces insectorum RCEF 264 TaxID=1081102 RepID=A0A167Y783_9HYPO|nr:hypothetical protein SPI_02720 [Niveomyces insectorum RCEF 264]
MPSTTTKRPIRIGGASGGFTDRQRAIHDLAKNCNVDVIVGDWMSECTMTIHGAQKAARKGAAAEGQGLYDPCFMGSLTPALEVLQEKGVRLAVNAGASDAALLAREVARAVRERGLTLQVAWIAAPTLSCAAASPTPRPPSAPPDLDALAGALMAGHLIECSAYVTGGYYSGFKQLFDGCENLGFPVAAIEANGETVLSKEANTGGAVSVGTVTSQLVYEIQGPLYYNSDVTANIEGIRFEQVGPDEVRVTGVKGLLPPPTTKVGLTAEGCYQAEFHYIFVGLDLEEKAAWTERQIRYAMGKNVEKLSCLKFQLIGSPGNDPDNQNAATADFRVFVQTRDPSVLGAGNMTGPNFTRWCMENFLQSAPGATIETDLRQSAPKSVYEYWVALLPQEVVQHRAVLEWNNQVIDIPPPTQTQTYSRRQKSYETANPVDLATFGPTTRGPLGWVVLGRSGDKASDANIGLFVRHDDEWDWLRSLLTTDKFIELLAKEYLGHGVDRFEMPNIRTVHFLLKDHLDRGFNSTSSLDGLGKNLCEFIRCRHVDIPNKFLARGKV